MMARPARRLAATALQPRNEGSRAVAYVRVSVERVGMISPALQMRAIREYCELRDYQIVCKIEDLDLSGRFWKTRQVDKAIAMLEQDEADVLVVWRWSRVSRNRLDWALALGRVDATGGRLESASEGFDTTTATGKFARGMLAEFAAFESDRMGDVWREVRDRRVALGLNPWGHDQFGYQRTQGSYVVDKKAGPILANLYRRYTVGESFDELTAWLHKHRVSSGPSDQPRKRWGHQTLLQRMDKGFAAGFIRVEGELLPGAHPAIISKEEWEAYLDQRRLRGKRRVVLAGTFLLNGMVFCSCGHEMRPHNGTPKSNYRCSPHHSSYAHKRARAINSDRLHGLLFRWLVRLSTDPRHASRALIDSREYAQSASVEARRLRAEISAHDPDPAMARDLARSEQDSAWRNPIQVARALTEDWAKLSDPIKHSMLEQIVDHLEVRTGNKRVVLTVHTRWQTRSRYYCDQPRPFPCEREADGITWLSGGEVMALAQISKPTLRGWREDGLLPLTRDASGRHLFYASTDVDRVLAAPRMGRLGVDRLALRRQLELTETTREGERPARRKPPSDPLPLSLSRSLRQARRRERAARTLLQRRTAIADTGVIMLAAVDAGWRIKDLCPALGLREGATRQRVRHLKRHPPTRHLPSVPGPPPATRHEAFPDIPEDAREWLKLYEAAAFVERSPATIRSWRRAGLLPHTNETTWPMRAYLRSDLDQVRKLSRPRYPNSYAKIRAQLDPADPPPSSSPTSQNPPGYSAPINLPNLSKPGSSRHAGAWTAPLRLRPCQQPAPRWGAGK